MTGNGVVVGGPWLVDCLHLVVRGKGKFETTGILEGELEVQSLDGVMAEDAGVVLKSL